MNIKEVPHSTFESATPAPFSSEQNPGNLSEDIARGKTKKRLTGVAGMTAGAVLASGIGASAQEEQSSPLPTEPTPIVSFMEIADTDQDGKLDLGEVLIGIPNYAEAVAQRTSEIAEEIKEQQEDEIPSAEEALDKVLNQKDKNISNPSPKEIIEYLKKLWTQHGESFSNIEIPGENKKISKKQINDRLKDIFNPNLGSARSLVASSTTALIYYMLNESENNTEKGSLDKFGDLIVDYTISNYDNMVTGQNEKQFRKAFNTNTHGFLSRFISPPQY